MMMRAEMGDDMEDQDGLDMKDVLNAAAGHLDGMAEKAKEKKI